MQSNTRRWIWIGLGAVTLILRYTLSPAHVEQYYSRGLFLWVRRSIDAVAGWFPIPLIYLFVLFLLLGLVRSIRETKWRQLFQWAYFSNSLLAIGAFLGGALFFFFLLWGFNYGRIPLVQQLGLKVQPMPIDTLENRLKETTLEVIAAREALVGGQASAMSNEQVPKNIESLLRAAVVETLQQMNYPTVGKVRGRKLLPKGVFLRFSSAGLYWPFVGEGNIDSGLHLLQQPFTMAHEITHGYGITNEGVCNFIAYLACQRSDNAFIRYAGLVSYWRYMAGSYQAYKRAEYQEFRATLPKGFLADLQAINDTLHLYPDIMPKFRNFAYDQYLKSQGISEGMASYSQIVMLVEAWREKIKN